MTEKTIKKMTGQTVNLTQNDMKTLKTHLRERAELHTLIAYCAAKLKIVENSMWRTIFDLHSELIDYDLNINWVEKTIKVRYELTEWEKQQRKEGL